MQFFQLPYSFQKTHFFTLSTPKNSLKKPVVNFLSQNLSNPQNHLFDFPINFLLSFFQIITSLYLDSKMQEKQTKHKNRPDAFTSGLPAPTVHFCFFGGFKCHISESNLVCSPMYFFSSLWLQTGMRDLNSFSLNCLYVPYLTRK